MMKRMAESRYEPNPVIERALDVLFILHADHEQNCSTSAMRTVGSSLVDPYSAVAAAAAALYGPLHGGANEAVLRMLQQIGDVKNVPAFIKQVKEGHGESRLMGFGHRVYKNYDPRARVIKKLADEVFEVTGRSPLLDIALELERIALQDDYFIKRKLYPNVDFYSGLIYQAIGFPLDMFPVLFAIPRTVGLAGAVGGDARGSRSRRSRGRGRSTPAAGERRYHADGAAARQVMSRKRRSWATGAGPRIGGLFDAAILGAMRLSVRPQGAAARRGSARGAARRHRVLSRARREAVRRAAARRAARGEEGQAAGRRRDRGSGVAVDVRARASEPFARTTSASRRTGGRARACSATTRAPRATRSSCCTAIAAARSSSRSARFRCAGCTSSGSTWCSSRCRSTRCGGNGATPPWPSANPARSNEGFAQAIHDLRALLNVSAPPELAMVGHEPRRLYDCVVRNRRAARLRVPDDSGGELPRSLLAPRRRAARAARAEREGITLEMMQQAMAIHTPLLRAPQSPGERVLVVAPRAIASRRPSTPSGWRRTSARSCCASPVGTCCRSAAATRSAPWRESLPTPI